VAAESSRTLSPAGARPIRVGASARVELAGEVVSGRVSYVGGEIVGMKTTAIVDGRIAEGDTVTLVVGQGDCVVAAQARVLAASGSFVRLSRRESSEELDRRRAVRVPLDLAASITYTTPGGEGTETTRAEITEMSATRCGLRCDPLLPVGQPATVALRIAGAEMTLPGKIVRAWRTDDTTGAHAGIQFDPIPAATTSIINRYLVEQLRLSSNPRANAGRRPPVLP
jgi:hypothetical protein